MIILSLDDMAGVYILVIVSLSVGDIHEEMHNPRHVLGFLLFLFATINHHWVHQAFANLRKNKHGMCVIHIWSVHTTCFRQGPVRCSPGSWVYMVDERGAVLNISVLILHPAFCMTPCSIKTILALQTTV